MSAAPAPIPRGALPCLAVGDLAGAADYYVEVLGFDSAELLGEPPTMAVLRRPGATVLLEARPEPADRPRAASRSWDAAVFVDDIGALAAAMRRTGAHVQVGLGITAVSGRTLEVRDEWGNVLAFAPATRGWRPGLRRLGAALLPDPVRIAVQARSRDREEAPHLAEFARFHAALPRRDDAFFMYFTRDLLHWVVNAESYVPPEVNLVLVGSALPQHEVDWIRTHLDRPFHNIRLGVDDNTVWEFLFAVCDRPFGWLDIDCFVLDPAVFADMTALPPDVAVNGIWTYDAVPGKPIACTHFAMVNTAVRDELRRRDRYLSPTNYDWHGSTISLLHPRTHCRVPTRQQRDTLLQVLPADERGRPAPPGDSPFFDTLVAYQVAALSAGYRTRPVRPLAHRTAASLEAADGRPPWQQDMSDELVHVGGVSYYSRYFHSPELRGMYLAADRALLGPLTGWLPAEYARRARWLDGELVSAGLSGADAVELVGRHLVGDRGLAPATAERILAGPAAAWQAR